MFHGWKLSLLGSGGNFLLHGGLIYMMNAFTEPLAAARSWERGDIGVAMSVAALCGALSMPLLSSLSLRMSLRLLMTLGALIGGASVIVMGQARSLGLFTLFFSIAWVSAQAFGGVIANILTSRWFERYQGRAFGVCNIGTSLSGAVLPFVLMVLIEHSDVSTAWTIYGCIVLCMAPVCWVMIRDTPEMLGLHVDNLPGAVSLAPPPTVVVPLRRLLRNASVYRTGLAFGCALMAGSAVMSQLKPGLVDAGFASYPAMTFMCVAALCASLGKYLWGWLCDRCNPVIVARVLMVCNALTLSLVLLPQNVFTVAVFVVAFGTCTGGVWTTLPAVVAFHFGRECFVGVYRVVGTFVLLRAAGYLILGCSHALTGSYDAAFAIFAAILLGCFILTLGLGKVPGEGMRPAG